MPPSHAEPAAPHWVVVATGVTALILVIIPLFWRVTQFVVVTLHEGGHAAGLTAAGHGVKKINMKWNGDGGTLPARDPTGLGALIALLLGYLGPTVAGVMGATMLAHGSADLLLWLLRVGLVFMLLASRGWFGIAVIAVLVIVSFVIAWTTAAATQAAYGYVVVWFLLIGGVRDVFTITNIYLHKQWKGSDPHRLRSHTHLPMFFWLLVFWAGTVGGLWLGYRILMGAG